MAKNAQKILLTALVAVLSPLSVRAATLYVAPAGGSYGTGASFSADVYVSSPDQSMNAASRTISFPGDKLEVSSISKSGSIFSLWAKEPSFSNAAGTISFEAIVLNLGYTGSAGKIMTITFKAKAVGSAPVHFSSASVLANDGQGTNILKGTAGATYALTLMQPGGAPSPAAATVPGAPRITSPTHPDQSRWYSSTDAMFSWPVPANATSARLLVAKAAEAEPTIEYARAIGQKEIPDLKEGVWYFHAQLGNRDGWGPVSHYRVRIDTEKPSRFSTKEIPRTDLTDPKATFVFDAADELSGIDRFDVSIDGGPPSPWHDDGTHKFVAAVSRSGIHTLAAAAVDGAGNALPGETMEFKVLPIPVPTIDIMAVQERNGAIVLRGKTLPDSQVRIAIRHGAGEPETVEVRSAADGKYAYVTDGALSSGEYRVWAETTDARGAKSWPSQEAGVTIGAAGKVPMAPAVTASASSFVLGTALLLKRRQKATPRTRRRDE